MTDMTTALDRAAAPGCDGGSVISVEYLHYRYGGSHVLQGVSFTVPAIGVTSLIVSIVVGKNKTLKAMIGLDPRTGRILLQVI